MALPLEEVESLSAREELRRATSSERSPYYSPWLHLATPSLIGVVVAVLCVRALHDVTPVQWLFALGVFVLSNATEWRAHRDLLHKRFAPLGVLYDRHTPLHHRVFVAGDMAIRGTHEFRMVLLPAYGIVAILAITAPPAIALWLAGQHNLCLLWLLVTTLYVVAYEWLHLSYHLPDHALVGPLRAIRVLRRHHERHHDPRLMQRWNFNVTVPLWDFVRGTVHRDARAAAELHERRKEGKK